MALPGEEVDEELVSGGSGGVRGEMFPFKPDRGKGGVRGDTSPAGAAGLEVPWRSGVRGEMSPFSSGVLADSFSSSSNQEFIRL